MSKLSIVWNYLKIAFDLNELDNAKVETFSSISVSFISHEKWTQ